MSERTLSVHAVVWRRGDAALPDALAEAFTRQGIRSEEALGPFDAMARMLDARRQGISGRVLVLVEPDQLREQETVRRALDRFDPGARCWGYAAAASPRLAPLPTLPKIEQSPEIVVRPGTPSMPRAPVDTPGTTPRRAGGQGPALKLTGAGQAPSPAAASEAEHDEENAKSPGSLLTEEELEMLLADENS